jgi:hypothetical protein
LLNFGTASKLTLDLKAPGLTSREKNKTVKEALDNDFTSKFNKWIYETKIKQ